MLLCNSKIVWSAELFYNSNDRLTLTSHILIFPLLLKTLMNECLQNSFKKWWFSGYPDRHFCFHVYFIICHVLLLWLIVIVWTGAHRGAGRGNFWIVILENVLYKTIDLITVKHFLPAFYYFCILDGNTYYDICCNTIVVHIK